MFYMIYALLLLFVFYFILIILISDFNGLLRKHSTLT